MEIKWKWKKKLNVVNDALKINKKPTASIALLDRLKHDWCGSAYDEWIKRRGKHDNPGTGGCNSLLPSN